MLEYQKNKQELIADLINERKNLKDKQVSLLLNSYDQKDDINHVLKKFGISEDNAGTEYIIELIANVYLEIKNEIDQATIRNNLKDKNSHLYKTIALEYFEKYDEETIDSMKKQMNHAFSKREKNNSVDLYNIFGGRQNINFPTFIYLISKYMYANKMLEKKRVFKL